MDASEQLDDLPVYTTPNRYPPKLDVFPKNVLQIILAAKWLVWHSSMCPPNSSDDLGFFYFIYPSSIHSGEEYLADHGGYLRQLVRHQARLLPTVHSVKYSLITIKHFIFFHILFPLKRHFKFFSKMDAARSTPRVQRF